VQLPAGIAPSAALTTADAVATGVTTTAAVATGVTTTAAVATAATTAAGVHGHARGLVSVFCSGSRQQLR